MIKFQIFIAIKSDNKICKIIIIIMIIIIIVIKYYL